MALANEACQRLIDCGLQIPTHSEKVSTLKMPPLGEMQHRPADDGQACVCMCERVTATEITNACNEPIGAINLDGVRRRTRALNGKCQGFYCLANVCELVSQANAIPVDDLLSGKS
jgi:glycerol-3-phosphate dehydrogenase